MIKVSQIFYYPIKSLPAISCSSAVLGERGLLHDRHWMLLDSDDRFVTLRELPELTQFGLEDRGDSILVRWQDDELVLQKAQASGQSIETKVWEHDVTGIVLEDASAWFSACLDRALKLVQSTDDMARRVRTAPDHAVDYSDSSQYLLMSESSVDDLSRRVGHEIEMLRFRPNIVVSGADAYAEDEWKDLSIGDQQFQINKSCARCKITTLDPATGVQGLEPLATLSQYRRRHRKIWMGRYMNLVSPAGSVIKIGDKLKLASL